MKIYALSKDIIKRINKIPEILKDIENWYKENPSKYRWKYYSLLHFLAFTGARISEALSISWNDVDLDKRSVILPQLKKRFKKEPYRKVPLHPYVIKILKDYKWEKEEKIWNISRQAVHEFLYKKYKINPHAFRHFAAIEMLKITRDLESVRRILGHSNYETLKIYLNLILEDLRPVIEQLSFFK
jgi:integrase/recombinase XerD